MPQTSHTAGGIVEIFRGLLREQHVLPAYQRQRAPIHLWLRSSFLISVCVLVGLFYGIASVFLLPYGAVPLVLSVLFLSFIVIWGLPDTTSRRYPRGIIGLFFCFFAAISVWPDYLSLSLPGLPWISARRAVAVPLTFLLLISLSQRPDLRERIKEIYHASPLISRALIVFFVAETASLALASPIVVAAGRYVNTLFNWWAVLLAALFAFTIGNKERIWTRLMVGFTFFMCVLNMAEVYNGSILWGGLLSRLPSFVSVDATLIEGLLRQAPYLRYRSKGIFTTSLSFAEYMALGSPFIAYYAARSRSILQIAGYLALCILVVVSIYLNGSRLGLIGVVVGYATFAYLRLWIERERDPRNVFVAAGFWLLPFACLASVVVIKSFGRLNALFFGTGMQIYSTQARWDQLALLPAALVKRPIFGHGPGMGGQAVGYYDPNGLLTIDSYFITAYADFGIVGGTAFFTVLIGSLIVAARSVAKKENEDAELSAAVAAALAVYLTVRVVLSQDSNQSIMFMLVAFVLSQAWKLSKRERPSP